VGGLNSTYWPARVRRRLPERVQPELALDEPGIAGEAALPDFAPSRRFRAVVQIEGRRKQAPECDSRRRQIRVTLPCPERGHLGLARRGALVEQQMRQRGPGRRLGGIDVGRGPEIALGGGKEAVGLGAGRGDIQQPFDVLPRPPELQGVGILRVAAQGVIGVPQAVPQPVFVVLLVEPAGQTGLIIGQPAALGGRRAPGTIPLLRLGEQRIRPPIQPGGGGRIARVHQRVHVPPETLSPLEQFPRLGIPGGGA
jgi:hypothetical protein